ncbi:hypothetical protein AGLY_011747 [Aphis glycines]|uniref:Uncharacterized protein n=1 Tax=Aphis glycines TaxID=307491 RepID=A0A6G0TBP5_APHGL|nr:hypothetical protein AGLY_011747 [Aphis glycines]
MLMYSCKVWTITEEIEKNLLSFKNKVLRICGAIYDDELGCWRRRTNAEIQEITQSSKINNYIKAQRLQWFRHVMRRDESKTVKVVIEYQPSGKRPRGRPKKAIVRRGSLDVEDWKDIIQDRERWKALTVVAKTFEESLSQEEEEFLFLLDKLPLIILFTTLVTFDFLLTTIQLLISHKLFRIIKLTRNTDIVKITGTTDH